MSIPQKYLTNLTIVTVLTIVTSITFFGWNDFTNALGGVKSFGALMALLMVVAVIIGGIIYLQERDYGGWNGKRITHLAAAMLIVLLLGAIGLSWISLPDGSGMKVLGVIILHLIAAGLSTLVGELDNG